MHDLELDVRPILRSGGEPFGAIMGAVGQLAPRQRLRLYASFRPEPLFSVMAAKGFSGDAQPLEGGDWVVVFTPMDGDNDDAGDSPEDWPDPTYYLDCTDPESPEAGERILSRIARMEAGEVLFALTAGEPTALYPRLRTAGHAWVGDYDEDGLAFRIMIRASKREQAP